MAPATPKQVVLVVEDTRPIADLICQTLNEEPQYEAIAVDNGAAALETLKGVKASLLILDVSLPGISGLELYDRLQVDEATRSIPVIFVTADSGVSDRLRGGGTARVLAKPFDLDELLAMVQEALNAPTERR
jgi:DNA-binding response OmpR family regulator